MDSLTHAFSISALLLATGNGGLIPFAVLGAVIPDIDIIFGLFSRNRPKYYLFVHGGITHSIVGALTLGTLLSLIYALTSLTGILPDMPGQDISKVILAFFIGTFSHIALDFLAYPGIPLYTPFSSKKHTCGVFPGPHPAFLFVSLVTLFLIIGKVDILQIRGFYSAVFIFIVFAGTAIKIFVDFTSEGEAIPSFRPLIWTIINETEQEYKISVRHIGKGISPLMAFERFEGVSDEEVSALLKLHEVKRVIYNSYTVAFKKEGGKVLVHDPLRESGHFSYPPYYKSIEIARID